MAQVTMSGGMTNTGLVVGPGLCGPGRYLCSSTSIAGLGTVSSPFSSSSAFNTTAHSPLNASVDCVTRFMDQNIVQYGTNATGVVNISGAVATWVSGTHPASSWNGSHITFAGDATVYSIVTASSSSITVNTSPAVQGNGITYSFPGIALDDNFSTGNVTYSGGDNDVMMGADSSLLGVKSNGGATWVFGTSESGGCLLNSTNGGENPNLSFTGAFGFSRKASTPHRLYHVAGQNVLTQEDITIATPMTTASTVLFDFSTCPGIAAQVAPGTAPTSGAILSIALNDTRFGYAASWTGGQGTGHFGFVWDPSLGCSTIDVGPTANLSGTAAITGGVATVTTTWKPNMPASFTAVVSGASNTNFNCAAATITQQTATTVSYTCSPALTNTGSLNLTSGTIVGNFGNVYTWCASGCGSATPVGQETLCYDPNYAGGDGIHDGLMTLNGNYVRIAGGCFSLVAANSLFWQVATTSVLGRAVGTSTCTPGNGYSFTGHPADGVSHLFITNNPTPNIRVETTNCSDFTNPVDLYTLPSGATASGGYHAGWPHPAGDDSNFVIMGSANSVGFSTPGQMTLTYLENEIFGMGPSSLSPPARFTTTYNSTNSGGFSCQNGIMFTSQDGNWAVFPSDGFENLGLDSAGNQLCSIFTVKLE